MTHVAFAPAAGPVAIPVRALLPWAIFVGLLALSYAPVRFLLDFLRWDDARYFGFTPGQYGSVLLAGIGFLVLRWAKQRAAAPAAI